jgi:hypothetical protein
LIAQHPDRHVTRAAVGDDDVTTADLWVTAAAPARAKDR